MPADHHNWKSSGRRYRHKNSNGNTSASMGESRQQALTSITEGSNERSGRTTNCSKSVTSESIDEVFRILENEDDPPQARKFNPTSGIGEIKVPLANDDFDEESLAKEIAAEIESVELSAEGDGGIIHSRARHHRRGMSESDDEEEGPVIYANHDDDDDFSQITSSIAGNTLYSHEYMFSSISFPKGKVTTNVSNRSSTRGGKSSLPSLDGTDSGGSGGSGISQLPPMDEKKSLVMDDDDFERFFGPSTPGASIRKSANVLKSHDEVDEEINVYKGGGASRSHSSMVDDGMTISDIYSYSPSTMGGESTHRTINSSNPLIWMYNQAYHIFNAARYRARRKKNDDFDENSLDDDTDYFAKLMSMDFNSGSPSNSQWKNSLKQKKFLQVCVMCAALFCMGSLVYIGDTRGNIQLGAEQSVIKTVTEIADVRAIKLRASKVKVDRSHEGMILPPIFENFADVQDISANTVPFFWHVPRAAGATITDILTICHRLHAATNIGIQGGHNADTDLSLVDFDGQKYLNVDISTSEGITRAVQMGFSSTNLVDVAMSSLLHDSAPLFSPSKKGKIFTMLRHPVDRMVSMFYFMQDNVWKAEMTYSKELAEISIENFFLKRMGENNWHVRFLTNQLTKAYVDENDFKLAKEVLRRKVLVGLMSEKDESFDRYTKQFGWEARDGKAKECQMRRLQWDWSLRHPHEVEVLEGNRLWSLISGQNEYDMKLYEYAQYLFEEQRQLFQ